MIKVDGCTVRFSSFPNGETKLVHESIPRGHYPTVTFKYENDSDLIKLMFVKNYLDAMGWGEGSDLIIYYMPYSRMDRSENDSPFTLKYVTNFINGLGFEKITVIEPHSNVTTALLNNAKADFINFKLTDLIIDELGFGEDDYIMFPDNGAASRYKDLKYPNILIGHKKRDFVTGEIQGLDIIGNIPRKPNRVLIVDDLSSYGGTFVYSSKKLRQLCFKEVYLLVAHAENSIFEKELFDHIDKLYTTDSILTKQNDWENKKFESQLKIFKMEDLL